jgi:hypothetical protein
MSEESWAIATKENKAMKRKVAAGLMVRGIDISIGLSLFNNKRVLKKEPVIFLLFIQYFI